MTQQRSSLVWFSYTTSKPTMAILAGLFTHNPTTQFFDCCYMSLSDASERCRIHCYARHL